MRRRRHGARGAGADAAARVVKELGPLVQVLAVDRAHVHAVEPAEVLAHAIDDALAAHHLVGVSVHRPAAEQVREAAVDIRRRPLARKDRAFVIRPRDDRLVVRGAALHAADLHEQRRRARCRGRRRRAAGRLVDRRGSDVIQRSPGRLGVELPCVARRALRRVGGQRVAREHRARRVCVRIVLLPQRSVEAPLVHGSNTARHEQLAGEGRQRGQGGQRHVVGARQGAVRLRRKPPVGQTAVEGEEHDQPLGRRRGHPLRLRFTLRDRGQERCSHTSSTQATEKNSAIECLIHGRFPFSYPECGDGMNRLRCSPPSWRRWSRSAWPCWS
jgi:hypothetical protein